MTITHSTVTAIPNNPAKDVSATAWNAAHTIGTGSVTYDALSGTLHGATAYVGFDSTKDGLTNYWYCDGTADDVQIQAAIAYVGGLSKGIVFCEPGAYDIQTKLAMNQANVLLQGAGWGTVFTAKNALDDDMINISASGCTVQDLYLDGNAGNQGVPNGNEINGIKVTSAHDCLVNHCYIYDCREFGFTIYGTANNNGITNSLISTIHDMTGSTGFNDARWGIGVELTGGATIKDNVVYEVSVPIYVLGAYHRNVIDGNRLLAWDINNSGQRAIYVENSDYNLVINNYCFSTEPGHDEYGIRVVDGDYNVLRNNYIYTKNDALVISGSAASTGNVVGQNTCYSSAGWGLAVGGVAASTRLELNDLHSSPTPFLDAGTGTIFPAFSMPFVAGTTRLDTAGAAWGYEIDANAEYAVANARVPDHVQQVVQWRIQANSLVLEADAMRLEIVGQGGGDNEAYNAEAVAVADKPSVSTNFVAGDQIYWLITNSDDADVDDFVGGDLLAVKVLHEAAGGADCATDAVFINVTVDYV
jgi:hypothetical protein